MSIVLADRPGWDDYFRHIAATVALRADCRRAQIGCVIVDQHHRIVATGYNGTPPGSPLSCNAGDCPRGLLTEAEQAHSSGGYENCINLHAEMNAVANATADLRGCTLYVVRLVARVRVTPGAHLVWTSVACCPMCTKLCQAAGLTVR